MNTLDQAAAVDAVTIAMHDRVALKSDEKVQGLIVAFRSERRVVVKWDKGDPTEQNTVTLKLLPKPKVATFCGYCLENFRLKPDDKKSHDDVLINSRNGQAFHLECAKSIAITVALRERHLQQAPTVQAPPVMNLVDQMQTTSSIDHKIAGPNERRFAPVGKEDELTPNESITTAKCP